MSEIKILPSDLINKIAAGEVVERPSSILKELLENSLDANAQNITVEGENGGVRLLKVIDDGNGMNKDNVLICLKRHATSKIHNLEDFNNILSFGFRGEALSSISSVSMFELITKERDSMEGTMLSFGGSDSSSPLRVKPAGCQEGTTVCVRELFYNVPARRKFLKSIATEYNWLLEVFMSFAVLYYNVGFKFIYNKKTIYNLPKTDNWLSRVKEVLGTDIAGDLLEFDNNQFEIQLRGFFGKPGIARKNRKGQYIFINGRSVNDYMISKAVKDAYGTMLPRDEFPSFILDLRLKSDSVDVNVHPRKTEVKFVYPQVVFRTVRKVAEDILKQNNFVNNPQEDIDPVISGYHPGFNFADNSASAPFCAKPSFQSKSYLPEKRYSSSPQEGLKLSSALLQDNYDFARIVPKEVSWKLLGQIHKSYLLAESNQGLVLIDQHAAAERVVYEKMKAREEKHKSQQLLMPELFELSQKEVNILQENKDFLEEAGFDISEFGDNTFQISAVPIDLCQIDIKNLVLSLISDLENSEIKKLDSVDDKRDLVFKYASCRGAVKFQDKLSFEEQQNLLNDIEKFKARTCPHGRPCFYEFSLSELGKFFKR